MKKIIILTIMFVLVFTVASFAQQVPESFWEAPLLLREGFDDMRGTTVSEVFREGEFKSNENLDGTLSEVTWKDTNAIEGNSVYRTLLFLSGGEVVGTFEFVLWWNSNNKTVLLDSVTMTDHRSGDDITFTEFSDKVQMIGMISSLKK